MLVGSTGGENLAVSVLRFSIPIKSSEEGMRDTQGLNRKSHHAVSISDTFWEMVFKNDIHMVEDIGISLFPTLAINESNGESASVMLLFLSGFGGTNGCGGEVINDPVIMVSASDVLLKYSSLSGFQSFLAYFVTVHILTHVDDVRGALDLVTGDKFSKVFGSHLCSTLGFTEWETVVGFWYLRVDGGDGVYLEVYVFSFFEGLGFHSGHIECSCGEAGHYHACYRYRNRFVEDHAGVVGFGRCLALRSLIVDVVVDNFDVDVDGDDNAGD